jgi:hypothetical protein
MPFCWMDESAERKSADEGPHCARAAEIEIKERAQLFCRLGYSKSDAVHRCLGNVAWAYSVSGTPALSPAKIRKLVASAYSGVG